MPPAFRRQEGSTIIVRELVTLLGFKVDDSGREEYNKGIDQTKQKQQSMTSSFLKANLIMGAVSKIASSAFGFIRDSVIGATAETERFRVVIGSLIGDQEKANQVIHDLDYSPVSDFYGTAAAIGGLRSFVTMGMDIDKASQQMTLLGDVAQGNSEAFNSLSANMAQVYSKGKADAMDLKQFMAQGFDVSGVLGLTEAQQKAGVTYAQVEEALKKVTAAGGPYNNMLAKQMNTLGGVLKQFESFKAATAEAIGNGINEELKEILKYILEIARAGQEAFVGKFVSVLKEVIHWIFQVIIMWEVLGYRLKDMGAFDTLKKFFGDLHTVAGYVLTGIMNLVVTVGGVFIHAFKTAYAAIGPVILALGPLAQKVLNFIAKGVQGLVPIIDMLKPPLMVIGTVLGIIIKGLGGIIDFLGPLAPLIIGIIAVIKIWTFVQWLLNAAMMANPIGLIVAAVIAAVALIVGLVMVVIENWSKIADFFIWLGGVIADAFLFVFRKIGEFFVFLAEKIKQIWNGIVAFFKKWGEVILQILVAVIFGIPGIIAVAVRQIIKHWDVIGPKIKAIWENIKAFFVNLGRQIADIFRGIVDTVVRIWNAIFGFFSGLWSGIVDATMGIWDAIKGWFSSLVEGIKSIWIGITGFFSGLWEAIMNGPSAAVEYIRNAFFGLFTAIQEKLFGFIGKVKEGWESVKGFFGGIADGVVNFFTGGDSEEAGSGGPQPAYAGATSQGAVAGTVGQTSSYAHTNYGGSTVNANTSINVNVPPGTPQEQSEAIARQVNAQFDARLSGSINSSRANIPSPEVRRH